MTPPLHRARLSTSFQKYECMLIDYMQLSQFKISRETKNMDTFPCRAFFVHLGIDGNTQLDQSCLNFCMQLWTVSRKNHGGYMTGGNLSSKFYAICGCVLLMAL